MAERVVQKKRVKRKTLGDDSYSTYIHRVLKQVHPDVGITKDGIRVVDALIKDMFERIASESGRLTRYNRVQTINDKNIQTATRLVLSGELCKHAVSEGSKAVVKYNTYVQKHKK